MAAAYPKILGKDYPFAPRFVHLADGNRLHYVDEGRGGLVLFLADAPSWSFHFRRLIQDLAENFRCLAPDYVGFGLSDKPPGIRYSLHTMADNVVEFCTKMNVGKFHLVLHGWGGLPGMVAALRWPERVKRIVLLNANCFPEVAQSTDMALARLPFLGHLLVQGLNLPLRRLAALSHPHPRIRRCYSLPYNTWKSRAPVHSLLQNLPSVGDGPFLDPWLRELQERFYLLSAKKVLAFWGMADAVFDDAVRKRWKEIFDFCKTFEFFGIGRQVLEGEYDLILPKLRRFLLGGEDVQLPQP
ncbi:MAG: alpha/beta fold hydrolase [Puniceicoccales bacterium]|jgi:haloalkane dehalogenase|nr:alpha/beta fold hydrolase [Puniceicoccales bacterium]